jgi:hypothetical protein
MTDTYQNEGNGFAKSGAGRLAASSALQHYFEAPNNAWLAGFMAGGYNHVVGGRLPTCGKTRQRTFLGSCLTLM